MSEKTYITPLFKEPEFVIVPMGAINEAGVKQKRKAIKFQRNARGVGQFKTADPKIQAFLEGHEWFKGKKMICVGEQSTADVPPEEIEQSQSSGPATSEPKAKGKPGRKAKVE